MLVGNSSQRVVFQTGARGIARAAQTIAALLGQAIAAVPAAAWLACGKLGEPGE